MHSSVFCWFEGLRTPFLELSKLAGGGPLHRRKNLEKSIDDGRGLETLKRLREKAAKFPDIKATEMNLLGILEAKNGKLAPAKAWLLKAAENAPKDPAPLNNLGNIAFLEGDYDLALHFYQRALKESVFAHEPRHNLILTYQNMGLIEQALSLYIGIHSVKEMKTSFLILLVTALILIFFFFFKR